MKTEKEFYQHQKNVNQIKSYLLHGNISNQDLYEILINNKQQQLLYNSKVVFQNEPTTMKDYDSIFPLQEKINYDDYDVDVIQPILRLTEDKIFKEVTKLKKQCKKIQEQLQKQNQIIAQRNLLLKAYENQDLLCEQAQREQELIINDRQIDKIIIVSRQIQTKIQLVKLSHEIIDQPFKKQQEKKKNLLRKQKQMNLQQQQKIKALESIKELKVESQKIKQDIRIKEEFAKNAQEHESFADQLAASLKERLEMEAYLQKQQQQKLQFMNILNKFNSNYKRVKQHNKKLKQKMVQKGLTTLKS